MRSKHLLLMLLIALITPLAANAQTLTVCNGTETSENIPVFGEHADFDETTSEFVIPDTLLSDMSGKDITSLKFYISVPAGGYWSAVFKVYMKEITETTLDAITGPDDCTVVYTGTLDGTGTEMTIPFNDYYTYQGGNLLIGTYVEEGSYDYTASFYGIEAETGASMYSYYENEFPTPLSFLPKTTFTYETYTTCEKPDGLAAALTPGNGTIATLSWTEIGSAENWVVQYGTDETFDDNTYTEVEVSDTPAQDLTGLTPDTTYYARVKADCGSGDESNWSDIISFTPTDAHTILVCDGTETNEYIPICGFYADYNQHNQMIYPATNFTKINGMYITKMLFYLESWDTDHHSDVGDWTISLGETTATVLDTLNDSDSLTQVYSGPMTFNRDHTTMTITFTEPYTYNGGNLLVDFDHTTNGEWNDAAFWGIATNHNASYNDLFEEGYFSFLPKVTFTVATCPSPINLTPTLTPGDGTVATLFWTEIGSAENWVLQYGTDETFAANTYTEVEVSDTTAQDLTDLTPETTYYARVKADCGSGDESAWSNIISFTPTDAYALTVCDGTATNQYIPFDGYNADSNQHNQMIYPSSSLTELNGMSITQLVFYLADWDTDHDGDVGDWTISLGETTATTLTGLDNTTQLTSVYSGPMTFNSDHTTMTITFTDPYTYNGGNLLVDFNHLGSSYNRAYFYGISTNYYASYNNYEDELFEFLPKTTFMYELPEACPKPTGLAVSNIMHTSADLSWNGISDNYNVQYREAAYDTYSFFESFENASDYADWQFISNNTENTIEVSSEESRTGIYSVKFSSYYQASDYNQYLVTPELNVSGTLKFYYSSPEGRPETFKVGYSSTVGDVTNESAWIWGDEVIASRTAWQLFEMPIPEGAKYVAINYFSYYEFYLCIDDFGFVESTVPAGEWQTSTTCTESTSLSSLTANTTYDVRVQADCGGDQTSSWRATSFTTLGDYDKVFTTAGNWDEADNWTPTGVPTRLQNAFIHANVTIPSGCVATAHKVTIEGTPEPTITLASGGQFLHSTDDLPMTVELTIPGYGTSTDGGYRLISIPSYENVNPVDVENLLVGDYDLYAFDATEEDEWRNYKATPRPFDILYWGKGYLYANQANKTLRHTGTVDATNGFNYPITGDLEVTTGNVFGNWILIGNSLVSNLYLSYRDSISNPAEANFYVMNEAGNGFVAASGPLAPGQGAFVEYSVDGFVVGSTADPNPDTHTGVLNMNLSDNNAVIDNARLRFGKGRGLGKFSFRENSSKLYIPQDDKDYAVVYAEPQGEMPVSFKAENNGSYTLSFNTENVEFGYLHLIDNMTGADIDLLSGDCGSKSAMTAPSYTFEAKTTDYASRFKLVFSTGNGVNDESFAFISDGNIIVNAGPSTGSGTSILQVVDVMGRIMMQEENATRVSTSGMTPGVYVLRLINGDSVRTQKIVVK